MGEGGKRGDRKVENRGKYVGRRGEQRGVKGEGDSSQEHTDMYSEWHSATNNYTT